jgi:hypothetical protein
MTKIIFDTISDKNEPVPGSIKNELKQASIRIAVNSKVIKLVEKYENLPLECDGMTRVLSYVLDENHISHKTMQGRVEVDGEEFEPHWWIDLGNGTILDYRLRMWFGNKPSVPNGIFSLKANPQVSYTGKQVNVHINEMLFKVLTMQISQIGSKAEKIRKIAKTILSNCPKE